MAYHYTSHTADIGFIATGSSIEDAFSEAAKAFTGVMTEQQVEKNKSLPVQIEAESKEALFFEFIDHLILLLDTEDMFVADCDLTIHEHDSKWSLQGIIFGDDAANYERHGDVKAPTYHSLRVEKADDGQWTVQMTVDI